MRIAFAISAAGHAAIIAVAYVGLPELFDRDPVSDIPITVELVTIAEVTAAPAPEPVPEPEPEVVEEPPPAEPEPMAVEAPPTPAPPEPPVEEPAPVEMAALEPEPEPPPRPERKPKPPPEPKPEPVAERPPPKPRAKPKKNKLDFDADRIAALLDKTEEQRPQPKLETKTEPPPEEQKKAPRTSRIADRVTLSEIDAIKAHIQHCWSVPGGARDAHELIVTIRIYLHRDGTLSRAPQIVDLSRMSDSFYRTMAESALRAVLKCEPLPVPSSKYEDWREIELTFNPREMMGG